ncbi:ABC transporter substrate-binding protein [Saccharopolyspora sp. 5N708]|uniref:ABC transporter substrate-binding protein n=1 Tax=Saccharopolyspora sp. 5N708 TaxID=3457424 RepID=UPI003FD3D632
MRNATITRCAVALLALISLLTACGSGGQSDDASVIKYGVYEPGTDAGYLLMAQEKQLFSKYGVKVEVVQFNSAQQAFPALLSGQVDVIQGNPSEALLAKEKGAPIKFIGSTMPGLNYVLYGKQDRATLSSLQGATVGISTPTALPALIAKEMLSQSGVNLASVKFVNSGGSPDRYKAVVSGRADAASSPLDFIAQANKDNIRVLAKAKDVVPDYPRYAIIAREDVLTQAPDKVVGLLAGLIEGIRYALDHEDEANALTAKTLNIPADSEEITSTYTEYKEGGYLSSNGAIPVKQIQYIQQLQQRLGLSNTSVDINQLIDDSFRQKAIEKIGPVPETYYGAK